MCVCVCSIANTCLRLSGLPGSRPQSLAIGCNPWRVFLTEKHLGHKNFQPYPDLSSYRIIGLNNRQISPRERERFNVRCCIDPRAIRCIKQISMLGSSAGPPQPRVRLQPWQQCYRQLLQMPDSRTKSPLAPWREITGRRTYRAERKPGGTTEHLSRKFQTPSYPPNKRVSKID